MADTDNSTHGSAEETPAGPGPDDTVTETPGLSEDSSIPEDPEDSQEPAAPGGAAHAADPAAAQADGSAAQPEPASRPAAEPEADHEHGGSRFGAQFSSPEPTAVVARPRRRATRPVAAPDPDAVEPVTPATPATPVPAFVSFMAPPADAPPSPRRRSRRPAESPEVDPEAPEASELPEADAEPTRGRQRSRRRSTAVEPVGQTEPVEDVEDVEPVEDGDPDDETAAADEGEADDGTGSRRRRRGRRGRGRGRSGEDAGDADDENGEQPPVADTGADEESTDEDSADGDDDENDGEAEEASIGSGTRRRRRRRRRTGGGGEEASDDTDDDDRPERAGRNGRTTSDDDVRGVAGSTRLEAKRQRRRDGRDTGRRRTPILTESEFLARREAVDRTMVIRQRGERTQIAVLEDDVLVEHYVTQAQATSFAGNVYLGRVQNVLPSMEAAFVDIGKGRNAVLYAGEVNWDAAGLSGKQRSIETAMKSGDKVLVQVTKDPIGHKGARLTQQINLPGRFLVFVPGGSMTGISRKLPDTERQRLKDILKKIVPEDAGVIIRTAAEGASEEELTRDVNRLKAQWEVISQKAESTSSAPTLLYGEPDLAIRVIRDVFNEDFKDLVVQGDDAWDTVEAYVGHVSPELSARLSRYTGQGDVFHDLRIDEQLAKALDRKVWLPSGGSLVIDRTEAMTVVDVNTGKFVGSGGNLEQTVTRNNMEAAEEIVRQLRLRDIGGIIVIDFIDMVLESNRDLVLRRLTECLGRDRTKHQVAEVTSLGLVQMTRKRVGQGLLEVFSETCEHCRGRGILVHTDPVDEKRRGGSSNGGSGSSGSGSSGSGSSGSGSSGSGSSGNGGGSGKGDNGNGGGNRRDRSGKGDNGGGSRDDVPAEQGTAESTPSAEPAADGDGEPTEGARSGGRRNRGRRNRGQSGEERAAADAAVLAGAGGDDTGGDGAEADDVVAVEDVAVEDVDPVNADSGNGPATPSRESSGMVVVPPLAVAQPAAEPAGEPVTDDDAAQESPGEEFRGDASQAAEPQVSQPEIAAAEVAAVEAAAAEVEPVPAAPAGRPRRRRAASRPAGPPVV